MSDTNDIVRVSCAADNCGTFPMDAALNRRLKRTGDTFTCPAGHEQSYGETEEARLRERVEELENRVERLQSLKDSARDSMFEYADDALEERNLRKSIQSMLLERVNGVVEVDEDAYLWGCGCGGRCQTVFDDERDAEKAFRDHRRDRCSVHSVGEGAEA